MARIGSLFLAAASLFFIVVRSAPADTSTDGLPSIGEIINLIGLGLVTHINVTLTTDTFTNNLVSVNFDVKNPLAFELTLDSITNSAGLNGTEFAAFEHTFNPPLVVSPFGTRNSGNIPNVLLTQGVEASLAIVPFQILDILNADANTRAGTIFGKLGIPVPIDGLKQKNVPTVYNFEV